MSSTKEQEILDACDNGTFKYAQQLAQKLVKKHPGSTYHRLLNNYVLLQMGKKEESIQSCREILAATPSDQQSIDLLTEMFESVGLQSEAQQVYQNAAKKYPTMDILVSWFHRGVETVDYRAMQKAAMSLAKLSSQRLFQVWAAFTCYLASASEDATLLEKNLFPKLGLKIAESLKPMNNEQEVYVLIKLLLLNGMKERVMGEILAYSKTDKLDLELQINLLQTLDSLQDWESLYLWSHRVLVEYKLDDFDTWKYLIKSGIKLERDVLAVISLFHSRNSQLALIEYNIHIGDDPQPAVEAYLTNFISKPCAFYDLKHYVDQLEHEKLLDWLADLEIPKGEKGLVIDVNVRKFKLLFNRDLLKDDAFMLDLIAIFNHYRPLLPSKSKTDFSATSEIILLVVQCLLTRDFSQESLITSVVILENAILQDAHEFHLRLWLIQLYMLLNCPTEALHHYDSLSIKQIQHDILDHYVLSRCSSVHPSASRLEKSYEIYRSNDVETTYFTRVGFNKGAYNKLEKMLEFQKRLGNSYFKKHLALQGVKMGRLFNDKNLANDYKNVKITTEHDNRDFNIFWNFGIDEALGVKDQLLANLPSRSYNTVVESIEKLVTGELEILPQDLDTSSLTDVERWGFNTIVSVHKYLHDTCKISEVSKQYQTVPKISVGVSWRVTHDFITLVDCGKSVQVLISTLGKQKKLNELKELNANLLSSLRDDKLLSLRQGLRTSLQGLHTAVHSSAVLKALEFDSSVDKIFELVESSHLEQFKLMRML